LESGQWHHQRQEKRELVSVLSGLLSNFKGPVKNKGILTNILESNAANLFPGLYVNPDHFQANLI
jgi:hypothetical protein